MLHQETSNAKKAAGRDASANGSHSLRDHYLDQLRYLPGLKALLGTASLAGGVVKSASDYSYSADRYAGDHFRIIGDASGETCAGLDHVSSEADETSSRSFHRPTFFVSV